MATPYLPFVLASLVLAAMPGAGALSIVARSLREGPPAGMALVGRATLSNLANMAGASLAIAVVVTVMPRTMTPIRLAGALYLIWLGIERLRAAMLEQEETAQPGDGAAAGNGTLASLLKPRALLFFAAFLPQFVDPRDPALLQCLALGAGFSLIAAGTETAYALMAQPASELLARAPQAGRWGAMAVAGVYVGVGVYAFFA